MSRDDIHFGQNCIHFRRKDNRCEVAIKRLVNPKYDWLHEEKWVSVKKAAEVLDVTPTTIEEKIKASELKTRRPIKGNLQVCVDQSSSYELCPLAHAGGQCLDFKPGRGKHIKCLAELTQATRQGKHLFD